jgi:hypothetical protein
MMKIGVVLNKIARFWAKMTQFCAIFFWRGEGMMRFWQNTLVNGIRQRAY